MHLFISAYSSLTDHANHYCQQCHTVHSHWLSSSHIRQQTTQVNTWIRSQPELPFHHFTTRVFIEYKNKAWHSLKKNSPPTGKSVQISEPRHVTSTRTRTRPTCNSKKANFSSHVYAQLSCPPWRLDTVIKTTRNESSSAKNLNPIANETIINATTKQC